TGESMGIDADPHLAYYRAALGAGAQLPRSGAVRLVGAALAPLVDGFEGLGFTVTLADGDAEADAAYDLLVDVEQTAELRRALEDGVPYVSTLEAAEWTLGALEAAAAARAAGGLSVTALQDLRSNEASVARPARVGAGS